MKAGIWNPQFTTVLAIVLLLFTAGSSWAAGPLLRPGDAASTSRGSCTLNFVYDGADKLVGKVYVGTAAHCIGGEIGSFVRSDQVGFFGRVVYVGDYEAGAGGASVAPNGIPGQQSDFALIEVSPDFVGRVAAGVRGRESAPCAAASAGQAAAGDHVSLSGWGVATSFHQATREGRSGALLTQNATAWQALVASSPGDSGGPVLVGDCLALGVVTGAHVRAPLRLDDPGAVASSDPPSIFGPTLEHVLTELEGLGWPLRLRTAS